MRHHPAPPVRHSNQSHSHHPSSSSHHHHQQISHARGGPSGRHFRPTLQRYRRPAFLASLLFIFFAVTYLLFMMWPELLDPPTEPPGAWDFKRATVREAVLREWGPSAELRREADGNCMRFVRPADEPPYGAVKVARLKKFRRRTDKNLTLSQFLMVPPLTVPSKSSTTGRSVQLGPPAARSILITLTVNSRVATILSMLESLIRFVPSAKQYPYYFFNDEPFREDVKEALRGMLCAFKSVHFEKISKQHWQIPPHVNRTHLDMKLEMYRAWQFKKPPHMTSLTYRLMCRWNSGPFALHPALKDVDYFWRIDDDLRFLCPVLEDPLLTMAMKKLVYGFGMTMKEIPETVPTLMRTVVRYADAVLGNRGWLHPVFLLKDGSYSRCHFWNNLALGDLRFFRSARYQAYFDHLDRSGGFFYERWGDAPVHTLGVALLSAPNQSYHFHDISYGHEQIYHLASQDCAPGIPNNYYRSDRFGESLFSCTWRILSETKQNLQRRKIGWFLDPP